jgi:peptidyl-prolyl isomerase E (cyclophilin E)
LVPSVTEQQLHAAFIPFGDIIKIQLPTSLDNSGHRGFAFVEYELPEDAEQAIYNMNLSVMEGKILKISLARPGKYQELQQKAIWEDEEYIKMHQPDIAPEIEPEKILEEEEAQKKQNEPVDKSNPKVFFDITIDSSRKLF